MATKILSNDFMQRIADEAALKEISDNLSWAEALLEKYQDKVDWMYWRTEKTLDCAYAQKLQA